MLTDKQKVVAARDFANRWNGSHYEDEECKSFWIDLLQSVFGVEEAAHSNSFINFEKRVKLKGATKKIDGYIPSTKVLIEQKSSDVHLDWTLPFSGLSNPVTAYGQANYYADHLPFSEKPRWIVTCNFAEFWIYDMNEPENVRKPVKVELAKLKTEYKKLSFLVDRRSDRQIREEEVSVKAGDLVAEMYTLLQKQYTTLDADSLKSLNILCMRIVFCLYAEDAGVFGNNQFSNYLSQYSADDFGERLEKLFEVLNTPDDERSSALSSQLRAFPYTNGGLFAQRIQIPVFSDELRTLILDRASSGFDWSHISPTIFGALFESTINPETRQQGGMHYTSIENIHKVIDPLFLDDLRRELEGCLRKRKNETDLSQRNRLGDFQDKLASLRFLDPACGSGNFLTETYLSLRELENTVIRTLSQGQGSAYITTINPIKVSIDQFYGIEINDFAVSVASVALWISEAKMLRETEDIIGREIDFLPLKSNANIREGNALRLEWPQADYIMGNPPFVGARLMSKEQKDDLADIFGPRWKNLGNMDYVCGWYKRAADIMAEHPTTRAALVSTNSITQGEQVANLWRPLVEQHGMVIDFAHRTFRWDNEATDKAHVHCVIVGFHVGVATAPCLFDGTAAIPATHINAYLMDAPDVWIESRSHPICPVPEIGMGNQPIDGGNYLFTEEEMRDFLRIEPAAEPYFHPWYGSDEFINNRRRYCLWLGDCTPAQLRSMPRCYERVAAVRKLRLESPRSSTRKLADLPTRFQTENMPQGNYIIVPSVSSERRRYVPMGFMTPDCLASNLVLIIPDTTLYNFGMLTSSVHMAWMRAVCGRLETRYRYSKDIVYNNFPWPTPTNAQKAAIEQTAQAILDARALYQDSSLAALYDELTMPVELRRAHQANDRAVMKAYGFPTKMTEEDIVAELFKRYTEITTNGTV